MNHRRKRRWLIALLALLACLIVSRATDRSDPRFVGDWLVRSDQHSNRIEWHLDADGSGVAYTGAQRTPFLEFLWRTEGENLLIRGLPQEKGFARLKVYARRAYDGLTSDPHTTVEIHEIVDASPRGFTLRGLNRIAGVDCCLELERIEK